MNSKQANGMTAVDLPRCRPMWATGWLKTYS